MFNKEKLLVGMGLTASTLGALGASYAVHEMLLDAQPGVHVASNCNATAGIARLGCGPSLVIPVAAEDSMARLLTAAGLFGLGASVGIVNARRWDNYRGVLDELLAEAGQTGSNNQQSA